MSTVPDTHTVAACDCMTGTNYVMLNTEHRNSDSFSPMNLFIFYSMHEYSYSVSFEKTKNEKKKTLKK